MDSEKELAITARKRKAEEPLTSPEDTDWCFDRLTCTFSARSLMHCHFYPFHRAMEEREPHVNILEKDGTILIAITLPKGVEADAIEATYKHGVLEVKMPRSGAPEHREVAVPVK
jgi:HSP20 family molecular chaperone IbpA